MRAQVAEVFAHLGRAGSAVEPDHVGPKGVQGRECGADLATHQHPPGRFDGYLYLQCQLPTGIGHRPSGPDYRRFGLKEVLYGFDHEEVGPAGDKASGCLLVAVAHVGEGNLAEGSDLGTRAERPCNPVARAVAVRNIAGDRRSRLGELAGTPSDPVLRKDPRQGTETVGLDNLAPDVEERPV